MIGTEKLLWGLSLSYKKAPWESFHGAIRYQPAFRLD